MFDWEDLRHFTVFAQQKSLSKAARQLKVEHATVARRIVTLEKALGLKLVERRPRAYFITADGERIAGLGARMERESFAVERIASVGQAEVQGEVSVNAPPLMSAALIAPQLGRLRSLHPRLRLSLCGDTRNVSLMRREAEIAISLSRPSDPELVVRRLGTVNFSLYATPACLAAQGEGGPAYIAYDAGMDGNPQHLWLQAQAGEAPIVLRSNELGIQLAAVLADVGIAVLPDFIGARDARLVRVPHGGAGLTRELWISMHSDLRHAPRIVAVSAFLAACLEFLAAPPAE